MRNDPVLIYFIRGSVISGGAKERCVSWQQAVPVSVRKQHGDTCVHKWLIQAPLWTKSVHTNSTAMTTKTSSAQESFMFKYCLSVTAACVAETGILMFNDWVTGSLAQGRTCSAVCTALHGSVLHRTLFADRARLSVRHFPQQG